MKRKYYHLFRALLFSYFFAYEALVAVEGSNLSTDDFLRVWGLTRFDLPRIQQRLKITRKPTNRPKKSVYGKIREIPRNDNSDYKPSFGYYITVYSRNTITEYSPYFRESYLFIVGAVSLGALLGYYLQQKFNLPKKIINSKFCKEVDEERAKFVDKEKIQIQQLRDKKYSWPIFFTGLGALIGGLLGWGIIMAKFEYEHNYEKYKPSLLRSGLLRSGFFPRY